MMQKVIFLALVVILTCFFNGTVGGKEFPEVWKRYIQTLCQRFDQLGVLMLRVVSAVPDYDGGLLAVTEPLLYLMPPVLMWSPIEQYSDLFPNGVKCPKCGNDDGTLSSTGWKDGSQGTSSEPRVIHDVNGIMLLVGRVYWCINNHTVAAHTPGIIKQFPIPSLIPFRLWHRTGFTVKLVECISSLVSAGISISGIEANLRERTLQRFFAKRSTWLELLQWHSQLQYDLGTLLVGPVTFPSLDTYQSYFNVLIPSRHAISGCFLAHFWEKESLYKACMQRTTLGEHEEWLSCDHTFKSVGEYSCM